MAQSNEQGGDELELLVDNLRYYLGRDDYNFGDRDKAIRLLTIDRKQHELEALKSIAKDNYAEDLGTYDFDGIAEDVFHRIKELEQS